MKKLIKIKEKSSITIAYILIGLIIIIPSIYMSNEVHKSLKAQMIILHILIQINIIYLLKSN